MRGKMTKKVYVTDLKEISYVKIACICGAKFEVPIESRLPPQECFACGKALDWQPVNRFIKGVAEIRQAVKDGKFQAFIETVEDDSAEKG